MGTMQGMMAKQQAGAKEFDAMAIHSVGRNFTQGLGITTEVVEESPQRVMTRTSRCPVYEAAQMVGLEELNSMETRNEGNRRS